MKRHDSAMRFPALQVVLPKYTKAQCLSIIAIFLKENGFTSTASILSLEGRHLNCGVSSAAHLTKEELDQHVALCISRLGAGPTADVEPADRSPAAHAKQEAGPHEPGGESVLDLINEDQEIDDGLGPCSGDAVNISRRATTEDVDQEGQIPGWHRSSSKSPEHDDPHSRSYRRRSDSRDGDDWRAGKSSPTRLPPSNTQPDSRHVSLDREEREEGEDDGNDDKVGLGSPLKDEEDGRDGTKQQTSDHEDGERKWRRSRSSSPAASGHRSPRSRSPTLPRAASHDSDRRRSSPDPTAHVEGAPPVAEGVVPPRTKPSAPKYLISSNLSEHGGGGRAPAGDRHWLRPEPERRYSRHEDGGRDYPAARAVGDYASALGGAEPRLYHERDKQRYENNSSRASPVPSQMERSTRDARPMPAAASAYGRERERDRDREPAAAYRSGERGGRDSPREYPRASTTPSVPSPGYERYEKLRGAERAVEKSRDGYDAYRRDRRPEPRGTSEGGRGLHRSSEDARGAYRSSAAEEGRLPRPRSERERDVRPSSESRGSGRARSAERGELRPALALLPPPPVGGARYTQGRDSAGNKRQRDDDYR